MSHRHLLTEFRFTKKCYVTKHVDVRNNGGLTSCFLVSYALARLTDRFCKQGLDGFIDFLSSGEMTGYLGESGKYHRTFVYQRDLGWMETKSHRYIVVSNDILIPSRTFRCLKFVPKYADARLASYLVDRANWDCVVNRLPSDNDLIHMFYTCHGGIGGADRASLIVSKDFDTNFLMFSLSDVSRCIDPVDEMYDLYHLILNGSVPSGKNIVSGQHNI